MWTRFTFEDIRIIAHYLGTLTSLFTVALLIPLITALVFQEWEPATRYFLAAGISLTIGSLLRMAKVDPGRLTRQQAMALTGFAWMFLAFIASVPLAMSGHFASYLDALFDSVSGLTTTGAALIMDLEHLSYADNMWRFIMHFLGGMGLIVIALSLGLLSSSTSGLYSSEGRSEHVVPNVITTTRLISKISLAVIGIATVLLMLFCFVAGMEPVRAFFHGLWISISGFMTAGSTPTSQSIMYYHSYFLEIACMLLMLLGMINFGLFVAVLRGKTDLFFKDFEIRTGFFWLVFMCIIFIATLSTTPLFSDLLTMIRRGVFMLISASSTTGFSVVTTNQVLTVFSSGAILILAILMAVGGLAVGESHEEMYRILDAVVPHLPDHKPTYLMGVGTPVNILEAVDRGVDFFDCVYPSRNGRHGHVYTNHGKLNLFNAKFELDDRPIEEGCQCPACRNYSRAYIRHLLKAKEMLGMRLCVLHNLYFYNTMMEEIRDAIDHDCYKEYKERKIAAVTGKNE